MTSEWVDSQAFAAVYINACLETFTHFTITLHSYTLSARYISPRHLFNTHVRVCALTTAAAAAMTSTRKVTIVVRKDGQKRIFMKIHPYACGWDEDESRKQHSTIDGNRFSLSSSLPLSFTSCLPTCFPDAVENSHESRGIILYFSIPERTTFVWS